MKASSSKKGNLLEKYNRILFALGTFLLSLHLIKLFLSLASESNNKVTLLSTSIQLIFNLIFLYDLKKKNDRIYFYATVLSIISVVAAVDSLILRIKLEAGLFAITTTALYIIACILIFILSYKVLFLKKNPTD